MSLMKVTAATLSQDLAKEIPEMYVVIAKHHVLGMDYESIREVLGCSQEDLQEVVNDDLYKEVRLTIGALQAESRINQTSGWDSLEEEALKKLQERLPYERDTDLLLRVAAIANKAQRRHSAQNGVLNPVGQNGRVAITLTQRLIQKFNGSAGDELIQERQLSISDGSMQNPTFDEVDALLSVTPREIVQKSPKIQIAGVDSRMMDDLESELKLNGI